MDRVKPCVIPMCTPMHKHAATMPGTFAENCAASSAFASNSIAKPPSSMALRVPTPLVFATRPVASAVNVVASIVAEPSSGKLALDIEHCIHLPTADMLA